jgi:CDP-diacylglycerol--glycerol-3-phosphate 3-phosphatidyltransferase
MTGLYAIKPRFQQALRPVEDWLVRRRVHPDELTLAALGLSVAGGVAIACSPALPPLLLAVPLVVLARLALNALDGQVARRLGLARPWGEVLNEVSDRGADLALLGGVLFLPGIHPAWSAALIAVLLASYTGIAGRAAGGRRQYGGLMGKADRMLTLAGAAPLAMLWDGVTVFSCCLGLILAGALVTVAQRLHAIHAELAGRAG